LGFPVATVSYAAQKENTLTDQMTQKLILGSRSPRRRELLLSIGATFDTVSPDVEEVLYTADPVKTVLSNALVKYRKVATLVADTTWILTADTVVFFEQQCYLKPVDVNEAARWFRSFSGRPQSVYTGFTFGRAGSELITGYELSIVWFKTLTEIEIRDYFRSVDPLDKAGAYDINEQGERIIDRWEGSKSNIMGLPLERIRSDLQREGLI
jgi:septum formation protein